MIVLGTIGIRYLEAGTLLLLLVAAILIFLRRRPAGLVWFSALAMGTMAAQLFIEEGRWQLAPAYLLLFVFCFWLARPAGQPYRSARAYGAAGLVVRVVAVVLVLPALMLPFIVPIFLVPSPEGPHPVGSASILVGDDSPTARLSVWYPSAADAAGEDGTATLAPFWSSNDLSAHRLPGLPWLLSTHLTLVPTPAGHRAQILDTELPLLLLLPSEGALPGDYLHLVLDAASAGWLVVSLPGEPGAERIVQTIAALSDPDTDAAISGRVDPNRLVVLLTGAAPDPELGVATIRIAHSSFFEAVLPSSRFSVLFPGAEIPASAFTMRSRMANPARLLVGSSDIAPERVGEALRHLLRTVLGDGSPAAPVFSGTQPSQDELLQGVDGATIRMLPAGR